jgi:biotin synthase-like enzyme
MMKQYCRYCGFCFEVDSGYYCGAHEKLMSESQIKRANNCKEYGYTDVVDVISGGQYHPQTLTRISEAITAAHAAQTSLFDGEG